MAEDTIFALSSGAGRAGVAVIRISGPGAGAALDQIAGSPRPASRQAALRVLRDPRDGRHLDQALVLWFPGPGSFTGEDCAELQGHGGRAVLSRVLDALGTLPGCRPAEPGEFTRRAVLNGKLDLTRAEGLLDLIDAETEAQRRQALAQADGALHRRVDDWHGRLLRLLAHGEAEIDFPDEGDAPEAVFSEMAVRLQSLIEEMSALLTDPRQGERLREGVSIAILGAPNAGKSTLLNALAQRDVAIVADEAGTTRDVLEVPLSLSGVPVRFADTAGLRETAHAIEREGMRRALEQARRADLRFLVVDAAAPALDRLDPLEIAGPNVPWRSTDYLILNKIDQAPAGRAEAVRRGLAPAKPTRVFALSAKTGDGFEPMLRQLSEDVSQWMPQGDGPSLTRDRHRHNLEDCLDHLGRARDAARAMADMAPELVAEDLRLAMRALGRITGAVDVEDILDVVFRDFCIGK